MISPPPSVEQVVIAARERTPASRSAFLERACANSPGLRRLVEQRLLADSDRSASASDPELPTSTGPLPRPDLAKVGRFAPGQVIAQRFTVIRFIDRGGMGEVYEVEDRFLQGVHVALKMILPEIAGDLGSSRRFEQEVLLARSVTHPNLCPIYDIARSEDPPPPILFLTMKLLAGQTLSSRLRQPTPIPPSEAVAIFRQMVAGLAAIHAAGILHRDIKPNNVMLDDSGPELCVSIMDFGLARLHQPDATIAERSLIAGTPGYMAPEILHGEAPSQAADIYALGVLMNQVLSGERPRYAHRSQSVEPSPALDTADVPPAIVHAVKEFLSNDPKRRSIAFDQIQSTFQTALQPDHPALLSRRQFAIGSALTACAAAAGIVWKWDRLNDVLHPLPGKRFVALVGWPVAADARMEAMIASVVDAIGSELARAEAFDHNLLILPHTLSKDAASPSQMNQLRESLGANLVLAASGAPRSSGLHLLLRVLDPATSRMLREKTVDLPLDQQLLLPEKAVQTAARLLDITRYQPDPQRSQVGTANLPAYAQFQAAEALMKQENDSGLDPAIEKYKQAIEFDPRYAVAQTKLAWAYLRSYALRGDAAALMLAGANCKSAIQLDPSLVDAHLALASVYRQTGDDQGASREMSKALSLDPSNPHTLIYQADFYADDNHWNQAEETFARVMQLRPNYWLAHQELGVVLDQQGKYREALIQFRAASLASPKNALAVKNVGTVYLQLGNLPEAVESLQSSFRLTPDANTAEALAEVFRLQQRYTEAVGYAERAVEQNPNEPGHWLELGDVYMAAGRFNAEAQAAYRQAAATQEEKLRTSPKDGPGWMLLALCRVKAEQSETAITLIAKAESLHADDLDSQLLKVRTLELVGRRDDALSTMARCLRRGPTLFQFQTMPDLERLRATPGYKSIVASATQVSS